MVHPHRVEAGDLGPLGEVDDGATSSMPQLLGNTNPNRIVLVWPALPLRPERGVDVALPTQDVALDELDITTTARYVEHGFPWREWDLLRERRPGLPLRAPRRAGVLGGDPVRRRETGRTTARRLHQRRPDPPPRLRGAAQRLAEFKVRQAERWGWDADEPLDMVYLDRPEHVDFRTLSCPPSPVDRWCGWKPISPNWRTAS